MSLSKENERELWTSYIRGSLVPETEERMEALMLGDEAAFRAYVTALSSLEQELPAPGDEQAFMQAVLEALPQAEQKPIPNRSAKKWTEHPLFHYVIAASITVLLLTGGFFDRLAAEANQFMNRPQDTSLSKRVMNATAGWFDPWKR